MCNNQNYFKNLNFNIDVKKLIPIGYIHQKLYARNYKTYRKKIECHTIWLWIKGKTIEVDDWYSYTNNVIEFYKNNFDKWKKENKKLARPRHAMILHANHSTGEIKLKDFDEYYKSMFSENNKIIDDYYKKYKNWREIILIPKLFDKVISEIDYLTTKK